MRPPHAREFVDAIAAAMGVGDLVHVAGTTVLPAEPRSGSDTVVSYSIAAHTVLWCDPALEADLSDLGDSTRSRSLDDVLTTLGGRGWIDLGRNHMLLLGADGVHETAADRRRLVSLPVRSIDADDPRDRALIDAFRAELSESDRELVDLDGDEFDDHMLAAIDERGIVALASQKPFGFATEFADIAVAVRPDGRGQGLGRFVVALLCAEILERGLVPLYRRDATNIGSVGVSAALGFVPVIEIQPMRRP